MKKHNFFALLLALGMVLSLFAGCGSSAAGTSDASADTESTNDAVSADLFVPDVTTPDSEEAETGPGYTLPISEDGLTYTAWMTYAPFAADLINVDNMTGLLVLDKIQEVTNIHFDITPVNGAAEQDNFNLMIAGGSYCDIISSMAYYSTGLEGAVEEGIIQDLAEPIRENCPIYWSYLSDNLATLMGAYTDSGYMPTLCVVLPEVGQEVNGMVLRQDWLDEFGMTMPQTYDDLYDYLDRAKTDKNAIFEMVNTDGMAPDLAYGLNIDLDGYEVVDGEVSFGPAQDSFEDYLVFMNKLYTAGIISQDFFSSTAEDLSSTARLDFGLGTNSFLNTSANNTSDVMMNVTEDTFQMAVMPYVTLDGTTENHIGPYTLTTTLKDDDAWAISADCKNVEPILELVEFLYSDEGYILTNYGVEGESFEYDENGDPQYTDLVINNPDGLSYFFASYVYATNAASGFFPYINDMSRTFYDFNDNQWQVYEDLKTLSDCTYNYPTFAVMSSDEATTYNSIESDLSTYMDSAILEFITGANDIETNFDSYVETLYSMGLQDMVDIKQAAYDRAMVRATALGV
jgi:putative aldouronate transport system substrate-binding protein